jgi:hypothetical protein
LQALLAGEGDLASAEDQEEGDPASAVDQELGNTKVSYISCSTKTVFIMIGVIAKTHLHMQGSGLLTGTVHKKDEHRCLYEFFSFEFLQHLVEVCESIWTHKEIVINNIMARCHGGLGGQGQ